MTSKHIQYLISTRQMERIGWTLKVDHGTCRVYRPTGPDLPLKELKEVTIYALHQPSDRTNGVHIESYYHGMLRPVFIGNLASVSQLNIALRMVGVNGGNIKTNT